VFRAAASHIRNWDSAASCPSPAGTGVGGTHSSFLQPLYPHSVWGESASVQQAAAEADTFGATDTKENEWQ